MKAAVIFMSSHGTTRKAVEILSQNLGGSVDLINLKENPNPGLTGYDGVIVGGSIHAGSVQKNIRQFIDRNKEILLTKKIGLFLCCMYEGDLAQKQFETAFPQDLREKAQAIGLFGGEFIFSTMNFIERQIVKKVSGITSDVSKIDSDAIQRFAVQFNQ